MKFNFKNVLKVTGGLAVGAVAVKLTDKMLGNLNENVRTFGQLAIGIAGPTLLKQKPGSVIESVGDGLAAVAIYKLLAKVPALSGVDDLDESIGANDGGYIIDTQSDLSGVDDLDESIGAVESLDD